MIDWDQIIREHLLKRSQALERACVQALKIDCGVRLDNRAGGAYTITVDPRVPARWVHEYNYGGGLVAWDTTDFDWLAS